MKLGGWKPHQDFLRIDGQTSGLERGELIKDFSSDSSIKLFLISSMAGSMGVNLVSANRVVLFDSHFNPTIDLQAIYRCYRYGQTRPVFAYRFLTQGTMEEKVYSRAVNKIGLGDRVIDGKALLRKFKSDEISELTANDDWVECDRCKKWRMFPPNAGIDVSSLPDNWYCEMMNQHDVRTKWTCQTAEKDSDWYAKYFRKSYLATPTKFEHTGRYTNPNVVRNTKGISEEKLVQRDAILKNLLTVTAKEKNVITKHYFHDILLTEKDAAEMKGETPGSSAGKTSRKATGSSNWKRRNDGHQANGGNPRRKQNLTRLLEEAVSENASEDDKPSNASCTANTAPSELKKPSPKRNQASICGDRQAATESNEPVNKRSKKSETINLSNFSRRIVPTFLKREN
jgi:hypothetical protein